MFGDPVAMAFGSADIPAISRRIALRRQPDGSILGKTEPELEDDPWPQTFHNEREARLWAAGASVLHRLPVADTLE